MVSFLGSGIAVAAGFSPSAQRLASDTSSLVWLSRMIAHTTNVAASTARVPTTSSARTRAKVIDVSQCSSWRRDYRVPAPGVDADTQSRQPCDLRRAVARGG